MKRYCINEIFYSIQGEGSFVGTPMVFIRFAGCNLRCPWCDTHHQDGHWMDAEEILEEVRRLGAASGRACFTGGEPLLQLDDDLIRTLSVVTPSLHLETNGTLALPTFLRPTEFSCITISPKQSLSESFREHPKAPCVDHQRSDLPIDIKIIWDDDSPEWSASLAEDWCKFPAHNYFVQPKTDADGSFDPRLAIEFIKSHPRWRLSIQVHKTLGIR